MKRAKFKVGDWVEVSAVLTVQQDALRSGVSKRTIASMTVPPFIAQVCGARVKYEGKIERDYEYGATFTATRGSVVYLVRCGMTNKSIEVFSDGLKHAVVERGRELPWREVRCPCPWCEAERAEARKYAAEQPRDAQGHFVKRNGGCTCHETTFGKLCPVHGRGKE